MDIEFSYTAIYFVKPLKVTPETKLYFYLSLAAVLLHSILAQLAVKYRVYNIKRSTQIYGPVLVQFVIYLNRAISMLLLMTCNGWVILAVILGNFVGYVLFNSKFSKGSEDGQVDPENKLCC